MAKTYKNSKTTSRRHRKYKIKGGNNVKQEIMLNLDEQFFYNNEFLNKEKDLIDDAKINPNIIKLEENSKENETYLKKLKEKFETIFGDKQKTIKRFIKHSTLLLSLIHI